MKLTPLPVSHLEKMPLAGADVLLRVDLNVPTLKGKIFDDFKMQAIKPTLDYLLSRGCRVIIATHLGRPKGKQKYLSTKILMPWFANHKYAIHFEPDLANASVHSQHARNSIVLLENLRFYPGEKDHDMTFAKQLAHCAQYFVHDAYGLIHRNDTSITLVPELFSQEKRTIGFLMQKELHQLHKLVLAERERFGLLIGGGKVKDKLIYLQNMIPKLSNTFVSPAICFTFLLGQNKTFGKSLVFPDAIKQCNEISASALDHNTHMHYPIDYHLAQDTFYGKLSCAPAEKFPKNGVGIAIGPETAESWKKRLFELPIMVQNGLMGDVSRPHTLHGAAALFQAMGKASGTSIVAGGDSVAAARITKTINEIDYCSTGGGATLAYLSDSPLPGLQVFL